jgi:four helix bundle protein
MTAARRKQPEFSKSQFTRLAMDEATFKQRTKKFALDMIALVESLPKTKTADVIGKQVLRSATSIGANYRAACRAKSTSDMINKLKIVEEETDESLYWLELLGESGLAQSQNLVPLSKEAGELLAMTVASLKTLRSRMSAADKSQIVNLKSQII